MLEAAALLLKIAALITVLYLAFQWGRMAERDDPTDPIIRDVELRLRRLGSYRAEGEVEFSPDDDFLMVPVRRGPYDWKAGKEL